MPNQKAVIFAGNNSLFYFTSGLKQPVSLLLQPGIIKDSEIVNEEELSRQIAQVIQQYKIPPAGVVVVVDPTLMFTKELAVNTLPEQLQNEKEIFLAYAPFQNPLSKIIKTAKSQLLIATNGNFYHSIKRILEAQQFAVLGIAPLAILGIGVVPSAQTGMQIVNKFDCVRQNGFIIEEEKPTFAEETDESEDKQSEKNKTIIGIVIFLILLGILGFVLWQQFSSPASSSSSTVPTLMPRPTSKIADVSPTAIPVLSANETTTAPVNIDLSKISIQIINGSGIAGQAEMLKGNMQKIGFQNIQTANAAKINSSKTLIVFSSSLPSQVRELIIAEIKKIDPNASTNESTETQSDVLITTASNPTP